MKQFYRAFRTKFAAKVFLKVA